MATIAPIHPGEVLLEEFLEPLGVTQHRLVVSIGVPPRRINEIVHGKRCQLGRREGVGLERQQVGRGHDTLPAI